MTCKNGSMNCGFPGCDCKVNALGESAPGRTDFSTWERGNLERFARHAADENLLLRTQLRDALDAWRREVTTA